MEFVSDPDKPDPKRWDPQHSDSGQNSMEYWDYSMELEILNGNPNNDLRIAAELGKTLLEANKTLELELKESLAVNDDQSKEIEYLTKQTAALREANDSRLRIYEHLDDAVQDLERTNQRLSAESMADKKKIKSLMGAVEQLESKNDDLQKSLEETSHEMHRGRMRRKSPGFDDKQNFKRSVSCEHSNQPCENVNTESDELKQKISYLEEKIKESQSHWMHEVKKREDLEIEIACQLQDNKILREQLAVYQERELSLRSIDEELTSLDDSTSLCRKCHGCIDETGSNYTMQDIPDELEDTDDISSLEGSLVRFQNGGCTWGSQESMASLGQAMNPPVSCSSKTTHNEEQPPSLLSELDTQYGLLIEKYKGMVEEHEQRDKEQYEAREIREKEKEEALRQAKLNLFDMRCQRCLLCTCDITNVENSPKSIMEELSEVDVRPKSIMEELSEVETSSSGFSDGESRLCTKATQTDVFVDQDDLTPTVPVADICMPGESQVPEYRRLLHLVYYNVKQVVDKDKGTPETDVVSVTSPPEQVNVIDGSNPLKSEDVEIKPKRPSSLDVSSSSRSSSRSSRKQRRKQADAKENIQEKEVLPREESRSKSRRRRHQKTPFEPEKVSVNARPARGSTEHIRCEHKKKKQRSKNKLQQKKTFDEAEPQYSKVVHPSVEVAKLIKLEMTYAEALKKASQRPLTHRNK